jgi:DNA-binding response OmpR family regulator
MQSNLILVVDDTEANRYAKCRMLRQAGFEVKEAAFGQEALQIVAKERPGVVCLDVRLPDINGLEVCRRIKADPALQTMVLQMSASFVGQEDRVRGLEGGADGYLISPFEPEEFLATVRSLFRLKHVEDELRTAAAQWRVTFDAIYDGILVIDEHGSVLRCNRAMVGIRGSRFRRLWGVPMPTCSRASMKTTMRCRSRGHRWQGRTPYYRSRCDGFRRRCILPRTQCQAKQQSAYSPTSPSVVDRKRKFAT